MGQKNAVIILIRNLHISKQSQKTQHTLFFPIIQASQESYVPAVLIAILGDNFMHSCFFQPSHSKKIRELELESLITAPHIMPKQNLRPIFHPLLHERAAMVYTTHNKLPTTHPMSITTLLTPPP
uniref:Uncharacterized protein n=1 Tax=Opuntia streptacantha TaxID=393608 RepID=A0A7C9CDH0_OPUST